MSVKVAANVWPPGAVGLSKHQLSQPTKGYIKIQMFISESQIIFAKRPLFCARMMTESARWSQALLLAVWRRHTVCKLIVVSINLSMLHITFINFGDL
jgi:hypothetical protein